MVLIFFVMKVFQKVTMFWMSLCFSLTRDSVSRNGRRQGFIVAWVCIARLLPFRKNNPLAAQLKIAFRRFLFLYATRPVIKGWESKNLQSVGIWYQCWDFVIFRFSFFQAFIALFFFLVFLFLSKKSKNNINPRTYKGVDATPFRLW